MAYYFEHSKMTLSNRCVGRAYLFTNSQHLIMQVGNKTCQQKTQRNNAGLVNTNPVLINQQLSCLITAQICHGKLPKLDHGIESKGYSTNKNFVSEMEFLDQVPFSTFCSRYEFTPREATAFNTILLLTCLWYVVYTFRLCCH